MAESRHTTLSSGHDGAMCRPLVRRPGVTGLEGRPLGADPGSGTVVCSALENIGPVRRAPVHIGPVRRAPVHIGPVRRAPVNIGPVRRAPERRTGSPSGPPARPGPAREAPGRRAVIR